jgi:hypothetical protein
MTAAMYMAGFHCSSNVMGRLSWQDLGGFPESFQPENGVIP